MAELRPHDASLPLGRGKSPRQSVPWLLFLLACAVAGCGARKTAPPPEPDAARVFTHLVAQVACGPRTPGSPGVECCRKYMLDQLRKCSSRVGTQRFSVKDPYGADSLHFVNIVANFYPERAHRVLLGAHYDTRPWADRDSGAARDLPVLGANDGASGVAVLLEVAQALSTWDPGIGVDLVCFDGEDYGKESELDYYCMGSKYFVRTMGNYRPRAMILLDMVGDRNLRIPVEGNSQRSAPQVVEALYGAAAALGVTQFVRLPGPSLYDDHYPFVQAGIPAVDLIDFDYPEWHTTRDLPDQCSPESVAAVTRVLLHGLVRLAAQP